MRKGLYKNELPMIAELVDLGRSNEELYKLFEVQPAAIDEAVKNHKAIAEKVAADAEAAVAERKADIAEAVEVALEEKAAKAAPKKKAAAKAK